MKMTLLLIALAVVCIVVIYFSHKWNVERVEEVEEFEVEADNEKVENGCPVCGSKKLFQSGSDEFWITCYGNGYWEKDYYAPCTLMRINICGECGLLYMMMPKEAMQIGEEQR